MADKRHNDAAALSGDAVVRSDRTKRPDRTRSGLKSAVSSFVRGTVLRLDARAHEMALHSNNAEENARSRPRAGQDFETMALWATEAYTPDTAERLVRDLVRLSRKHRGLGARDPAEFVRLNRRRPGSSFELYLNRRGTRSPPMGFEIDLPDLATYAVGTIACVTPSLTLITVRFSLATEERRRLHEVLDADYPTRTERQGGRSTSVFTPEIERRRHVAEARSAWSAQATAWFAEHLPGLFCGSAEGVPTCELTVLSGLVPFPADHSALDNQDRETLGNLLMSFADVFEAEGNDGMRYAAYPDHEEQNSRHSILAMTKSGFMSGKRGDEAGDGAHMLHEIDRSFRPVVARWTIRHVIEHFDDQVRSTRDDFAGVIGGRSAARAIERVRRDTAACADAETVAREVLESLDGGSMRRTALEMTLRARHEDDGTPNMSAVLAERLRTDSRSLLVDVGSLDRMLHAQASLLSAHANLRLQPLVVLLAVVSMVAGVIAAIEPVTKLLAKLGAASS